MRREVPLLEEFRRWGMGAVQRSASLPVSPSEPEVSGIDWAIAAVIAWSSLRPARQERTRPSIRLYTEKLTDNTDFWSRRRGLPYFSDHFLFRSTAMHSISVHVGLTCKVGISANESLLRKKFAMTKIDIQSEENGILQLQLCCFSSHWECMLFAVVSFHSARIDDTPLAGSSNDVAMNQSSLFAETISHAKHSSVLSECGNVSSISGKKQLTSLLSFWQMLYYSWKIDNLLNTVWDRSVWLEGAPQGAIRQRCESRHWQAHLRFASSSFSFSQENRKTTTLSEIISSPVSLIEISEASVPFHSLICRARDKYRWANC